jgi:hypothetical protein
VGIAKRLYGRRHFGGDYRCRQGKPIDVSPGKPARCGWCLGGEEAGPVVEDLDGRRLHDECRARLGRPGGEAMARAPAQFPGPQPAPELPRRDRHALARGPLPVPSEGREHRIHDGCGGAGCDACRGTGYATMGRAALAALKDRILALEGSLPDGWLAREHAGPSGPPSPPDPAPAPTDQPAFAWD